jgi:hypothetical protein
MEHRWNEIDMGKPKYAGEKPVPMPLCPPQIPHGLNAGGMIFVRTKYCRTVASKC